MSTRFGSEDDMKTIEIKLTQGQVAVIDAADLHLVFGFKWRAHRGLDTFYAVTWMPRPSRKMISMHRLILGVTDRNLVCDHRDGEGLNNRRGNLRACTHGENLRNSRLSRRSSSGLKGAHFHPRDKVWVGAIRVNNKQIHLGTFKTKEDAHDAYCVASKKYHGEFGRTS
jgi:hypothetical protein